MCTAINASTPFPCVDTYRRAGARKCRSSAAPSRAQLSTFSILNAAFAAFTVCPVANVSSAKITLGASRPVCINSLLSSRVFNYLCHVIRAYIGYAPLRLIRIMRGTMEDVTIPRRVQIYSILTALILHRSLDELLKTRPLPLSRGETGQRRHVGGLRTFHDFSIWPFAKWQSF